MNKITISINDYACGIKSHISYETDDATKVMAIWDTRDERLERLHVIDAFKGYFKWSELTPEHYRLLVTRSLNALAKLSAEERTDAENVTVSTTNFIIMAFLICLEKRTSSEIEHFRINRFDALNVTFDYSATFDPEYTRPTAKDVDDGPSFSIVFDKSGD